MRARARGADLGEPLVEPTAQLLRIEILMGAPSARNHDARCGHPR
jgi:hypothetical protein